MKVEKENFLFHSRGSEVPRGDAAPLGQAGSLRLSWVKSPQLQVGYEEEVLHWEGGRALEQAAQAQPQSARVKVWWALLSDIGFCFGVVLWWATSWARWSSWIPLNVGYSVILFWAVIQGSNTLHPALLVSEHQITYSSSFCPARVWWIPRNSFRKNNQGVKLPG